MKQENKDNLLELSKSVTEGIILLFDKLSVGEDLIFPFQKEFVARSIDCTNSFLYTSSSIIFLHTRIVSSDNVSFLLVFPLQILRVTFP